MNIHPRIAELAKEYVESGENADENVQAYECGWLKTAASEWYRDALTRVAHPTDPVIDNLCAEIGFWRGVDMLHKAKKGEPLGDPTHRLS